MRREANYFMMERRVGRTFTTWGGSTKSCAMFCWRSYEQSDHYGLGPAKPKVKGDSHQIWRTQRVQVNVASLRLFLRPSTGPNRAFEPQPLGRVRDPVRIAEGPTAIEAATQRRHFGFRLRLVDNLQPIGGGSGRGHPLSGTWETWMAPNVTADLDGDLVSHEGPNVQAVRCPDAFAPGEISGRLAEPARADPRRASAGDEFRPFLRQRRGRQGDSRGRSTALAGPHRAPGGLRSYTSPATPTVQCAVEREA